MKKYLLILTTISASCGNHSFRTKHLPKGDIHIQNLDKSYLPGDTMEDSHGAVYLILEDIDDPKKKLDSLISWKVGITDTTPITVNSLKPDTMLVYRKLDSLYLKFK